MHQSNNLPGLFKYSNSDDMVGTIVLDAVIGTELLMQPGVAGYLSIGLTGGTATLEKQIDIDAFNKALAEHQALKHTPFATAELGHVEGPEGRLYSATGSAGLFAASAPGGTAESVGQQVHAEAQSLDGLLSMLETMGAMQKMRKGEEQGFRAYKIELAGVDLNDPVAVAAAAKTVGQAIAEAVNKGLPSQCVCGNNTPSPHASALLGTLPIHHESNAWIRRAVDAGASAQAKHEKYDHSPLEMAGFIFHLAYQAEEAAELRRKLQAARDELSIVGGHIRAASSTLGAAVMNTHKGE